MDRESVPLLLTVEETLQVLNVGRSFLYQELLGTGRLPSVRLGRKRMIRRSDIKAFVDQLTTETGS